MAPTLANAAPTTPDKSLVAPRPKPAKVTTPERQREARLSNVVSDPDKRRQGRSGRLSDVVSEAGKQVYGKQGAVAVHLGKDEGNFARDLRARRLTLGHLEDLGDVFLAALGKELVEEFGPVTSPAARARRILRDMRKLVDEFEQFVEHVTGAKE